MKLADLVKIDLKRYGKPKIDQHKVPIAPTAPTAPPHMVVKMKHGIAMKSDTTAASQRIENAPPPGKKTRAVPARNVSKRRVAPAKKTPAGTTTHTH